MRFLNSIAPLLAVAASAVAAASSWSFEDGSVVVSNKKGSGEPIKETLTAKSPISKPVPLASTATLRVTLTATENGKPKRPHQAFLLLKETQTGLEAPFPLTMRETGKGSVDVTLKDLPVQLLLSPSPLEATLVVAAFGADAKGYMSAPGSPAFKIDVKPDPNAPLPKADETVRYGKRPEIHHIFRADPKSPPVIVSLFFTAAVLVTLPGLFGAWILLGGNLAHLPQALSTAPVSHALFFGAVIAMELVFYAYYATWNLFQALPVMTAVGAVAFLSGSKALGEVQARRLKGER